MSMQRSEHVPVLADEVLESLRPQPGQSLVDGTLGGGGHTRLLAQAVLPAGRVLAIDRDPDAVLRAQESLAGLPVKLLDASYADLPELLRELEFGPVDGVLLDLGLSSDQLADWERGFSFSSDGPLDLRFDPRQGQPAWQLLARIREKQLADWIYQFGQERYSRRIARRIVERRRSAPIRTAAELAELVRRCVPRRTWGRIDPATRTFQALRIAVNRELQCLESLLGRLPQCLRPGGRIAIISYHSLEDRRVKEAFRDDNSYEVLTRKPIRPSDEEVQRNARSRSAKLRVAARVDEYHVDGPAGDRSREP